LTPTIIALSAAGLKSKTNEAIDERQCAAFSTEFHAVQLDERVTASRMPCNVHFSIAVHLLAELCYQPNRSAKSADLAASLNTNASFVRRFLAKLAKHGLVNSKTGRSGAYSLAGNPKSTSLLQIYRAVESPKSIAIHQYAAQEAFVVSWRIKVALEKVLAKPQDAMEASLSSISLAQVVDELIASRVAIKVI
jgi:Rrf2 family protein